MTEGLLNSPFHDKSNGDRRRDLDEFRSQLAGSVFVEVGRVGGKALQAADLPLFKHSAQGLEQVVRLRLLGVAATGAPGAVPEAGLSVSFDGAAGRGGAVAFEHRGTALAAEVLVPEVHAAERCGFTVRFANGDVACRANLPCALSANGPSPWSTTLTWTWATRTARRW